MSAASQKVPTTARATASSHKGNSALPEAASLSYSVVCNQPCLAVINCQPSCTQMLTQELKVYIPAGYQLGTNITSQPKPGSCPRPSCRPLCTAPNPTSCALRFQALLHGRHLQHTRAHLHESCSLPDTSEAHSTHATDIKHLRHMSMHLQVHYHTHVQVTEAPVHADTSGRRR